MTAALYLCALIIACGLLACIGCALEWLAERIALYRIKRSRRVRALPAYDERGWQRLCEADLRRMRQS